MARQQSKEAQPAARGCRAGIIGLDYNAPQAAVARPVHFRAGRKERRAPAGAVERNAKVKESTPQRLPRAAHAEPPAHAPNAALLIDFDNVTLGIRSDLQNQLRRLLNSDIIKGKVSVQRAYADWRRYPQYIVPLSEASIDLIFAPAFGSNKKNATDIRLAIDALELVFTRPEIGTFILLSGDSDFSSLVLKLKEYGKYVIGVGLRESSSDLLIQNCDEYYSYSELTGLSRESEEVKPRRDPWELAIEAVTTMKTRGDVMRSDRLKQVMQELDPSFDEKEFGFSRFSKFVLEAGQRGLLRLSKMENGQYQIDLGPNANVPAALEEELREQGQAAADSRRPRARERVSQRLTLAQAFGSLKEALIELGAVGEEATDAEQVRELMMERSGAGGDPVFERSRFQRLLRQAHDANLIELVKSGDLYLLRLVQRPQNEQEAAGAERPNGEEQGMLTRESPAVENQEVESRSSARKRRAGRDGARGGGRGARAGSQRPESESASPAAARERKGGQRKRRDGRLRGGLRTASGEPREEPAAGEESPKNEMPVSQAESPATLLGGTPEPASERPRRPVRSLRMRVGSRGYRPIVSPLASQSVSSAFNSPAQPDRSGPSQNRTDGGTDPSAAVETSGATADRPEIADRSPEAEGGGLLKRVRSAIQKAVRGRAGEESRKRS